MANLEAKTSVVMYVQDEIAAPVLTKFSLAFLLVLTNESLAQSARSSSR